MMLHQDQHFPSCPLPFMPLQQFPLAGGGKEGRTKEALEQSGKEWMLIASGI